MYKSKSGERASEHRQDLGLVDCNIGADDERRAEANVFVVEGDFDCTGVERHHSGDATVRVKDIGVVAELVWIESALPRWHTSTISLGTINTPFTSAVEATGRQAVSWNGMEWRLTED